MKLINKYVYELENCCGIIGNAEIVGQKEKLGTFGSYFSNVADDDRMGESSFEKGERRMLLSICENAVRNAKLKEKEIQLYLGGDLMNQLVSSNYTAEKLQIPFVGIYSACATITASLALGALLIDSGMNNILCSAISHFSSAERQYRYPLEFGNQRQCYSQWTVTAGGAFVLSKEKCKIAIKRVCFGKVQDYGVIDIANMGAAMAPAACDTLCNFFEETKTSPKDFDLIATGDLGKLGSDILRDLMSKRGFVLGKEYMDCGHSIYSFDEESYQGGSGAGCAPAILSAYIINKMNSGVFKKVLLIATGALMSTVTNQQGDSIPCVAHLVELVKV